MNPLKIVGGLVVGAAAGVGTVVLLPVFGPVGMVVGAAGWAVGAGGGGLLGLGGGIALDQMSAEASKETEEAIKEAARATAQRDKLQAKLQEAAARFTEYKQFEEFVVSMLAVGFGLAAKDGSVQPEVRDVLTQFVVGTAFDQLPQPLRRQITKLAAKPPSFNTAMDYLSKIDPDRSDKKVASLVTGLINLVSVFDEDLKENSAAWRAAWLNYRVA